MSLSRILSLVPKKQLEECRGKPEMPVVNLLQHVCYTQLGVLNSQVPPHLMLVAER